MMIDTIVSYLASTYDAPLLRTLCLLLNFVIIFIIIYVQLNWNLLYHWNKYLNRNLFNDLHLLYYLYWNFIRNWHFNFTNYLHINLVNYRLLYHHLSDPLFKISLSLNILSHYP